MRNKFPYMTAGFTLIETMIALTLSLIVMMGVMSTIQFVNQSAANTQRRVDLVEFENLLFTNFVNTDNCNATFMGAALPTAANPATPLRVIQTQGSGGTPTPLIDLDSSDPAMSYIPSTRTRISSMELRMGRVPNTYTLEVNVNNTAQESFMGNRKGISLPVTVSDTTGDGNIDGCTNGTAGTRGGIVSYPYRYTTISYHRDGCGGCNIRCDRRVAAVIAAYPRNASRNRIIRDLLATRAFPLDEICPVGSRMGCRNPRAGNDSYSFDCNYVAP